MAGRAPTARNAARPFVGRAAEIAAIEAALPGSGPQTTASVVLVVGEAGIGKTTLVEHVLATVDLPSQTRVVRVGGDEAEVDLDFGVVDQLARAAGIGPRSSPADASPLDVGAWLVKAVDDLDGEHSLVVVLDDAHVADVPSLDAITFAARRLQGDRLTLVVTTRPAGLRRLPAGLLRRAEQSSAVVELTGLAVDEVGSLAEAAYGRAVPGEVVERLHHHTEGHPLHATVLLESVDLEALAATTDLGSVPSLPSLVVERLVSCSGPARGLLEALSVLGDPAPIHQLAAMAGLDDPLRAIAELEALGLVAGGDDPSVIAFRHQLTRRAVQHNLTTTERVALHRAAATVTTGDQSLAHRVAAALGPDGDLVADLVAAAEQAAGRGARPIAAQHLFAAVPLAAPADHDTLLLRAADHLLAAGRPLGDRLPVIEGMPESALRDAVVGRARMAEGSFGEGKLLLEAAWAAGSGDGAELAAITRAAVAENLAIIAISTLDIDGVLRWATALEGQGATTLGTTMLCHGLALRGDFDQAIERAGALVAAEPAGEPNIDARLGLGIVHLWSNRVEEAVRDLSSALSAPHHSLVQALSARSHLADAHLRIGNTRHAIDLTTVAIELLEDSQAVWLTPLPHSVAAYANTVAGDLAEARHHAEIASAYARHTREATAMIWAECAWLRIADAEQDHAAAAAAGDRMLAAGLDGMAEGINHWRGAYAEALAQLGRHDDAAAVLDGLDGLDGLDATLARSGDLALATEAARARAALAWARGDAEEATDALQHGLALDPVLARPLARGRLELAAGALYRRQGQRTAAAEVLQVAADRLRAIGARPWLERCEQELAACGLRPARRSDAKPATELTPRERVIAALVAEGRTNREVAAQLYISAKTVEHHLSRIYDKLGVRSRTQMAAALAAGSDPLPPP